MRAIMLLLILAIGLALGAGTGWYWWTEWRFVQSTDDAYVQSDTTVISPKVEAALGKVGAAFAAEQNQLAVLGSLQREEEARLAQSRASLQLARNDLDNTIIRAPVDGIAGNRAGRVGQYVKPGTQLLSLVPLPYVYVTANFKETQLTHMWPGQLAEISVDAYPGEKLTGRVESFAPASGA